MAPEVTTLVPRRRGRFALFLGVDMRRMSALLRAPAHEKRISNRILERHARLRGADQRGAATAAKTKSRLAARYRFRSDPRPGADARARWGAAARALLRSAQELAADERFASGIARSSDVWEQSLCRTKQGDGQLLPSF
jgi:hypothetical protein